MGETILQKPVMPKTVLVLLTNLEYIPNKVVRCEVTKVGRIPEISLKCDMQGWVRSR